MPLDLYCWLTYRASYAKKPSTIPWAALAMQFGSDYARLRDFKASFLAEVRKVATVCAGGAVRGHRDRPGREAEPPAHSPKGCPLMATGKRAPEGVEVIPRWLVDGPTCPRINGRAWQVSTQKWSRVHA